MTSIDVMIIISLVNIFVVTIVICKYKKRKRELERRLGLIERHVLRLEKNLRQKIKDVSDNTFIISKGLIELFTEVNKNGEYND